MPTKLGVSILICTVWSFVYISCTVAVQLFRSDCRPWPWYSVAETLNICLGVRERTSTYAGGVVVHSEADAEVGLSFQPSDRARQVFSELASATLGPRGSFAFEAPASGDFDFRLVARLLQGPPLLPQEIAANVVRNGTYKLVGPPLSFEEVSPPPRRRSERLADAPPGLSFSFSASGWLLAYQFGAAECLQNHGITRNPYARMAGTSGGALSLWTMMYGCDMKALKEFMKASAMTVYKDFTQSMNLRAFVLDAMKTVLRDCSFRHPTFQQGRVEIALSEAPGLVSGFLVGSRLSSRRVRRFNDSADVAIALLASSSIGISGMPFAWGDGADGSRAPLVADGAFTDFMPEVDERSIKLKPFSDALNFWGKSPPDVAPTEFVPISYGVWPPDAAMMDHLFELGYRDMEAWLDRHLEAHLAALSTASAPAAPPPPSTAAGPSPSGERFECSSTEGGMEWYEKVRSVVPIDWREQLFSGPTGT